MLIRLVDDYDRIRSRVETNVRMIMHLHSLWYHIPKVAEIFHVFLFEYLINVHNMDLFDPGRQREQKESNGRGDPALSSSTWKDI